MAGRMGGDRVTTQNLVVHARSTPSAGLILVKGAVPGPRGGLVLIPQREQGQGGAGVTTTIARRARPPPASTSSTPVGNKVDTLRAARGNLLRARSTWR
jgi:hypothetical protein